MKCEKGGCAGVFRVRLNTEALKEREKRRRSQVGRSHVS